LIRSTAEGAELQLHIQPRASRTELAGTHGGALKIRIAAPPVDDAANAELIRFLAQVLEVPSSRLELRRGRRSRRKVVLIRQATPAAVREALSRG